MAHGKTLLMRNIRRPEPVYLHHNFGAPRWVKRNPRLWLQWLKDHKRLGGENTPYVNSKRDQRPGRRLRTELRTETR